MEFRGIRKCGCGSSPFADVRGHAGIHAHDIAVWSRFDPLEVASGRVDCLKLSRLVCRNLQHKRGDLSVPNLAGDSSVSFRSVYFPDHPRRISWCSASVMKLDRPAISQYPAEEDLVVAGHGHGGPGVARGGICTTIFLELQKDYEKVQALL